MNSETLTRTLIWIAGAAYMCSFPAVAQAPSATPTYRYRAVDLGTLGGPGSLGCPICRDVNNEGVAIFEADTAAPDPFQTWCLTDCNAALGVRYWNGGETTLNAMTGAQNAQPFWISDTNLISGFSENGRLDPATAVPEMAAVLWIGGHPISLGTLGGLSSVAFAVNNLGQVTGGATNTTPDPLATDFYNVDLAPFPVSTEMHAFLWTLGRMRDLGTLGGPDSFGFYVNDSGQVAGISYTGSTLNSTTGSPTLDPFLWDEGRMKDLGTLGGTQGIASGLTRHGHVIGQSNLAGDATFHPYLWRGNRMMDLNTLGGNNGSALWATDDDVVVGWADLPGSQVHHAFLWKNGVMTDLGTASNAPCSIAYRVNAKGQVVGNLGDGTGRGICGPKTGGFLWENNGPMVDLSTLFAPLASGLKLFAVGHIGDDGTILGTGRLPDGDRHAMLLVPCDSHHPDAPGCHATPGAVADPVVVSDEAAGRGVGKGLHKPSSW